MNHFQNILFVIIPVLVVGFFIVVLTLLLIKSVLVYRLARECGFSVGESLMLVLAWNNRQDNWKQLQQYQEHQQRQIDLQNQIDFQNQIDWQNQMDTQNQINLFNNGFM